MLTLTPHRLRAVRKALGLTQAALGHALGISKIEVYRKETAEDHAYHSPVLHVQVLALRWLLHVAGFSDAQVAKITGKEQ